MERGSGSDTRDGHHRSSRPKLSVSGPRVLAFCLMLMVFNIILASSLRSTAQPTRVQIPYTPTFLGQVSSGNVSSISSKGATVQGVFRRPVRYPAHSTAARTTLFTTEVPEFANSNALIALLRTKGVVVNASPPSSGDSVLVTLLLYLGPSL